MPTLRRLLQNAICSIIKYQLYINSTLIKDITRRVAISNDEGNINSIPGENIEGSGMQVDLYSVSTGRKWY